jgi:transcriptional regulator with XRE-family HTH domain
MTIGERIKKRRMELGMSQETLAKKIGYSSRSSINKIELDVQQLRQSKIKAIATALNTTTSYIMGWDEKEPEPVKVDVFINEIMDITSDANDSTKRAILDYAYFILEKQKKDKEGGIAHVETKS